MAYLVIEQYPEVKGADNVRVALFVTVPGSDQDRLVTTEWCVPSVLAIYDAIAHINSRTMAYVN